MRDYIGPTIVALVLTGIFLVVDAWAGTNWFRRNRGDRD